MIDTLKMDLPRSTKLYSFHSVLCVCYVKGCNGAHLLNLENSVYAQEYSLLTSNLEHCVFMPIEMLILFYSWSFSILKREFASWICLHCASLSQVMSV